MSRELDVTLGLDDADDPAALRALARKKGVSADTVRVVRRAIDARKGSVRFQVRLSFEPPPDPRTLGLPLPVEVKGPARAIIVGDGPCGLFCAYELARHGVGSVVVDRGRTVQPRRVDLKGLNQHGVVDADSNYCFGEGGAGTYSDGKLYTRSTKRGDVKDVLETFVVHDAPVDILTEARPHIGSNLLPKVVTQMREWLEQCGVRFLFGARVTDLLVENGAVRGVQLSDGREERADNVVIATGHSARDVYAFLRARGVSLEAKAFALGVRIEHPQPFINELQYGRFAQHPKLSAAAYSIVENVDQRGVFSFCMCPGGFVVPASTDASGLVVNGMSLKRRDSPFANSGLVVSVEVEDAARAGLTGPFACLEVQQRLEAAALAAGGGALRAPAARAPEFLSGRASKFVSAAATSEHVRVTSGSAATPATSYQPGLVGVDLAPVLDASGVKIADKLRRALVAFEKRMPGYAAAHAILIGVESRTSAPVRVLRDAETLMSPDVVGLYPAGEGAGYAGGIVSAALDGIRVAKSIIARL